MKSYRNQLALVLCQQWDYAQQPSKDFLQQVLKQCHCLITIHTSKYKISAQLGFNHCFHPLREILTFVHYWFVTNKLY